MKKESGSNNHVREQCSPTRLLRIRDIIRPVGPIPVGRSTWLAGVKSGRFPPPYKLGCRITVWSSDDIDRLLQDIASTP